MRFVPRPQAEYEIKAQPEASEALLMIAREAELVARNTARVGKTGKYRDAMRSTVELTPLGYMGVLYNKDYKANWLERGTGPPGPTPAYHTLYNALRAIGLLTYEV